MSRKQTQPILTINFLRFTNWCKTDDDVQNCFPIFWVVFNKCKVINSYSLLLFCLRCLVWKMDAEVMRQVGSGNGAKHSVRFSIPTFAKKYWWNFNLRTVTCFGKFVWISKNGGFVFYLVKPKWIRCAPKNLIVRLVRN